MRIQLKYILGQLLLLFYIIVLCACAAKKEEAPVIPPVTSPLSGDYIGFGVITESFTHVMLDPSEDSASLGYLRRGSMVQVLRRQTIRTDNNFSSWVLIDGNQYGWLKEEVMTIYNSESQAITASESINR